MKSFLEYMDSKGKINSPEVKVVADKVDCPEGRKYAPEQKGVGSAHPYSNGKSVKTDKESGFGDKGHSNLKYNPCKDGGKDGVKAAKLPTAENYDLFQAVRQVIQDEPTFMEQLVREFKRNGLLPILVGEMVSHKETFNHLAEVMASESHGPEICKKLARALREDVAPPFTAKAATPVDAEIAPEEEPVDGEDDIVPDEMNPDEEPVDGEEEADIAIGPDGLPTSAPPKIGPDGRPLAPMGSAMENLIAALNILKS